MRQKPLPKILVVERFEGLIGEQQIEVNAADKGMCDVEQIADDVQDGSGGRRQAERDGERFLKPAEQRDDPLRMRWPKPRVIIADRQRPELGGLGDIVKAV